MKILDCLWWVIPAIMMGFVTFMGWYTNDSEIQVMVSALSAQIFVVAGLIVELNKSNQKDT